MTIEPPAARPSTNIDIEGLYAECLPRVYTFALRMLGDREAALDVAQDSFAVALARADSFDVAKMAEFGAKLRDGLLDRSAIRGETYCLAADPAVGFSVWEAEDREGFEALLSAWRPYYSETEVLPLITSAEAMTRLARQA